MDSTVVVRVYSLIRHIFGTFLVLSYYIITLLFSQTSKNATHQMEVVNTIVLTPLGASSAAVTQGTSWMEMD